MNAHAHKAISSLRTAGSYQDTVARRAGIKLTPTGETIELRDPSHMTMRSVAGWTVRALSGTVWLTQDGDLRDIVLEPGQSFTFDRAGLALVGPLGEAKIRICRNAGAARSSRSKRSFHALRQLLRHLVPARVTFV